MFSSNLRSSSSPHEMRPLFWLISRPETPTPPALTAFAGPNMTPASTKASTATCSQGMLAASATALTPFLIKVLASSALISFCVAEGTAQSPATPQGRPSWNVMLLNSSAASETLPRRTAFNSLTQSICSWEKPSAQWIKPPESDIVSALPPNCRTFSQACVATLPEPETSTLFPSMLSLCWANMLRRKKIAP